MVKDKIRYQKPASEEERCQIDGCKQRGRYVAGNNQMCYGHMAKWAVDNAMASGLVKDAPHTEYERKFPDRAKRKRKYG